MAAFQLSGPPNTRIGEDADLWVWSQNHLTLGLAVIGTDGNVEAALELDQISRKIRVSSAVLVGMAAGLKGEVHKGDIVIASWVVAYEFARITKKRYVRARSRTRPILGQSRRFPNSRRHTRTGARR